MSGLYKMDFVAHVIPDISCNIHITVKLATPQLRPTQLK